MVLSLLSTLNIVVCLVWTESSGASEAARGALPAEDDGLPLGPAGSGHARRPPTPAAGLAEVPAALPASAGPRVWVGKHRLPSVCVISLL